MMSRARLSLEGLSVGDAFGEQLLHCGPVARELALEHRADPRGRVWGWTDDTAMAISIVEQLEARGAIEPAALAAAFARRYYDDPMRGYGAGAHRVLALLHEGMPHETAARVLFDGQGSCGNGGGMRAAPIGACFAGAPARAATEAARSAAPTHAHPEGVAGAVAIAAAAAAVFAGEREPRAVLEQVLAQTPPGEVRDGVHRAVGLLTSRPLTVAGMLGNGSRVLAADTVPFALWCAVTHLDDYAAALWTCVEVGGDIDTTCAMVGGIVVGAVGLGGIPQAWRDAREPLPI
ncbi:MAG TPA: ADP-ribosylglycohydrolase family protein [Kofleriaceae bacterium]|jgi:ADP-ribosylglycohydrolase